MLVLRNNRQGEVIAVPSFIVRLILVAANGEDGVIGQVGKGACKRVCGGVTNRSEHSAISKSLVRYTIKIKLRAALDSYAIRHDLVRPAIPCVELVGVGAVGFKAERVFAGENRRLIGSNTWR